MNKFKDFFESWWFLNEHPAFGHPDHREDKDYNHFNHCLSVEVVKVCPSTERIENAERLNTATRFWLECGATYKEDENEHIAPEGTILSYHDWDLNCGAPTFEEAIVELSNLVYNKYGDYYEKG